MNVCDKLNKKQTVLQFICSSSSLRNFCSTNVERDRLIGYRTTEGETVIRQAINAEQLQTEFYRVCKMEISEAESAYNGGSKYKDINTFYCDPTEQICVSLAKELQTNSIFVLTMFGFSNLNVNLGMDKWEDGLMYSALLCTKDSRNNSAKRRRPIAFAEKPAVESVYNVQKLLDPISKELLLLKDNSCILKIGNECAILRCFWDDKVELDHWWRNVTNVSLSEFPKTMEEAENYKRKTRWNLIDENVDKLYVLNANNQERITLSTNMYPDTFICCDSYSNIDAVYIYKKTRRITGDKAQFKRIGFGQFWNGAINLEASELRSSCGTVCFPFDKESELMYLAIHDGGDLSGLDSRYNLANHSCTYFCVYCQIDDKFKLSKDGNVYRTRYNIHSNADLYPQAITNSNTNQTPLQITKGVAGRPVDPYPECSRITPPLLHIDMGINAKLLRIHEDHIETVNTADTDYKQAHKQKLDQYGKFTNRYYHSLEGTQAKLYRQNFSDIASSLHPSNFYICMNGTIQKYNKLMSIIGKSDCWVEEQQCDDAQRLLDDLDRTWTYTRTVLGVTSSLGTKYHYLAHCVEYMRLWRILIGYISEQSIESYHKRCSMLFRRYRNQRGLLRIKYALRQLMLITSPLYQS